jgi:hypothetical protein
MFVQKHCMVPITQYIKRAKSKIDAFINHFYKKKIQVFSNQYFKNEKNKTLSFNALEQVHQQRYNNL